jgi:hypothetical protein
LELNVRALGARRGKVEAGVDTVKYCGALGALI